MIRLHHYFKIPNKLKDLGIYQWLFTSQEENISHYMPPNPDERIHYLPMKLSKKLNGMNLNSLWETLQDNGSVSSTNVYCYKK